MVRYDFIRTYLLLYSTDGNTNYRRKTGIILPRYKFELATFEPQQHEVLPNRSLIYKCRRADYGARERYVGKEFE